MAVRPVPVGDADRADRQADFVRQLGEERFEPPLTSGTGSTTDVVAAEGNVATAVAL